MKLLTLLTVLAIAGCNVPRDILIEASLPLASAVDRQTEAIAENTAAVEAAAEANVAAVQEATGQTVFDSFGAEEITTGGVGSAGILAYLLWRSRREQADSG